MMLGRSPLGGRLRLLFHQCVERKKGRGTGGGGCVGGVHMGCGVKIGLRVKRWR